MRSLAGYDDSLKEVADYQFYLAYDFYAKNNSHFHRSPYYGYYQGKKLRTVMKKIQIRRKAKTKSLILNSNELKMPQKIL